MQRDIEEVERAEKEVVVATTRAQEALSRAKRATDSGATPTPPLSTRQQSVYTMAWVRCFFPLQRALHDPCAETGVPSGAGDLYCGKSLHSPSVNQEDVSPGGGAPLCGKRMERYGQ